MHNQHSRMDWCKQLFNPWSIFKQRQFSHNANNVCCASKKWAIIIAFNFICLRCASLLIGVVPRKCKNRKLFNHLCFDCLFPPFYPFEYVLFVCICVYLCVCVCVYMLLVVAITLLCLCCQNNLCVWFSLQPVDESVLILFYLCFNVVMHSISFDVVKCVLFFAILFFSTKKKK